MDDERAARIEAKLDEGEKKDLQDLFEFVKKKTVEEAKKAADDAHAQAMAANAKLAAEIHALRERDTGGAEQRISVSSSIMRSLPIFEDKGPIKFRQHLKKVNTAFRVLGVHLDSDKKTFLLSTIGGLAVDRIATVDEESEYFNTLSYADYAKVVVELFQPSTESSYSKSEYAAYVQRKEQDILSYLEEKRALAEQAYGPLEERFDYFKTEICDGLFNNSLRYDVATTMKDCKDFHELKAKILDRAASERDAVIKGYCKTDNTLDGLATTMSVRRTPTVRDAFKQLLRSEEEPMDINAFTNNPHREARGQMMKQKPKPGKCRNCNKPGHWARECRAKKKISSDQTTMQNRAPKKVLTCFYCKKKGHKEVECRYKKAGKPRVQALEEETEDDDDEDDDELVGAMAALTTDFRRGRLGRPPQSTRRRAF